MHDRRILAASPAPGFILSRIKYVSEMPVQLVNLPCKFIDHGYEFIHRCRFMFAIGWHQMPIFEQCFYTLLSVLPLKPIN